MAPNLTVYGDPFSANTRIVTIVLEMLELKYEFRSIDVMHGDHLSSNFHKVSERFGEWKIFQVLSVMWERLALTSASNYCQAMSLNKPSIQYGSLLVRSAPGESFRLSSTATSP